MRARRGRRRGRGRWCTGSSWACRGSPPPPRAGSSGSASAAPTSRLERERGRERERENIVRNRMQVRKNAGEASKEKEKTKRALCARRHGQAGREKTGRRERKREGGRERVRKRGGGAGGGSAAGAVFLRAPQHPPNCILVLDIALHPCGWRYCSRSLWMEISLSVLVDGFTSLGRIGWALPSPLSRLITGGGRAPPFRPKDVTPSCNSEPPLYCSPAPYLPSHHTPRVALWLIRSVENLDVAVSGGGRKNLCYSLCLSHSLTRIRRSRVRDLQPQSPASGAAPLRCGLNYIDR